MTASYYLLISLDLLLNPGSSILSKKSKQHSDSITSSTTFYSANSGSQNNSGLKITKSSYDDASTNEDDENSEQFKGLIKQESFAASKAVGTGTKGSRAPTRSSSRHHSDKVF